MSTRWAPLTLKKLLKALADVSDWRTLGINLEVNYATLNKIERDYPKSVHQMSQMLYTWLSANTGATWEHIVTALREMNLNNIAKNIEAEYRYSSQEQKSQMEQSDVSPPTSATPLVSATQSIPPPLVTSPRATDPPTPSESTSLITDSEGPPISQVAVPETISQIMPHPLVADSQFQLPVATRAPLVNSSLISPPPTTEGMPTSMDAEDSEEDRLQVVEEEIGELDRKFRNLVLNAGEYLTKKESIPGFLSMFRINLVHPPAPQVQQHVEFFIANRKDLISASSVEEVFLILGCYWNWWNYSLLQHVIGSFGSQQLKDELHCYLKDLEDFEKDTIVEDFICACHSYLGVPPEFTEVRTRMKGDWTRYTVYQIRKLARKLARKIARSSPFVGMSHSSIVLIWAVPSTVVHVLAAAIDEEFLQSNKIETVTIDGKDLSSYQSQDRQSETPSKPVDPQDLHKACEEGNVELTLDLLDAGVDVDTRDENERTPLMTACRHGRLDIVHLLLCFNADVNAREKVGWTALSLASYNGHTEVVHAMLMAGAHVDAQPEYNGRTALMWASRSGHSSTVRELLDGGASVNIQDNLGWTALFLACWRVRTEVVRELLQRQADVNIPTKEGLTPLITATKRGYTAVVELLLSSGKADTEIQEQRTGWTALLIAANDGNINLVRLLLQYGANPGAVDKHGLTALDIAQEGDYTAVCEELHKYILRQTTTDPEKGHPIDSKQLGWRNPTYDPYSPEHIYAELTESMVQPFPPDIHFYHVHGKPGSENPKSQQEPISPSKTEKFRVIMGPGDPSHQEHSVKKKGVRPPQEVAETTSTH